MRGRRWRAIRAAMCGLPLLMLLIAGLFAMHGLQASSGPMDAHPMSVTVTMPSMDHHGVSAGHDPACPQKSDENPCHGHPGGQVCLALLVLAWLLVLSAYAVRRTSWMFGGGRPARRGVRYQGRAPPSPSIFQLSVLRQ